MKIPEGARICPYCHTEYPDEEYSTMEQIVYPIIALGGAALLVAIIILLVG